MADNNPKPPPKPPTRPLDDKMKDLDSQDRLDNFEIQRLMSRESSDPRAGGEIAADPDEGGEVSGFGHGFAGGDADQPATVGVTDALGTYDPVEHGFGAGAPPRPVTMTAADLGVIEDPDAGGEVVEDPDAGGEILMPADDGGEIMPELEPVMIVDTYEPFEPEPQPELEVTDLEIAVDLHEAGHTFDD